MTYHCLDCDALVTGGPTRCVRCVKDGPPGKLKTIRRFQKFLIAVLVFTVLLQGLAIYLTTRTREIQEQVIKNQEKTLENLETQRQTLE